MENPEVIILECPLTTPHDPHTERYGFLWLKRNKCRGVSYITFSKLLERKWPKPRPAHKHQFQYKPSQKHLYVNPDRYVWICKDQKCDHVISSDKEEFRGAMLHKGRAVAKRLPPLRRSWRSN